MGGYSCSLSAHNQNVLAQRAATGKAEGWYPRGGWVRWVPSLDARRGNNRDTSFEVVRCRGKACARTMCVGVWSAAVVRESEKEGGARANRVQNGA